MIRVIFDNGELIDCEHINEIYIDIKEVDKIVVVGELSDIDKIENTEETHD